LNLKAACLKADRFFDELLSLKHRSSIPSFSFPMISDEITAVLTQRFGEKACQQVTDDAWQVDTETMRLLAIRMDASIKLMIPIMPIVEAEAFMVQMMEANFDSTQMARYAFHQEVVWGVFQYEMAALNLPQFQSAVDQLLALKASGISDLFSQRVEAQLSQIIVAAKQQGQSLEATLKMLDRFYSEGMMGDMGSRTDPEGYSNRALEAWQRQLERLWPTIKIEEKIEEADL
jgi:hypothetical protein